MTVRTYEPRPGRSIRPPDLAPGERDALRRLDPPVRTRGKRRGELVILIVLALALALFIKTFLVQAFFIPSGSMIPTLEVGDRVIVEKVSYRFREPRRGEVVVFRRPGVEERGGLGQALREFLQGLGIVQPDADIDLIKRIVGLPGETIEVRDGQVLVDGRPLEEPYAVEDVRDFPPRRIPEGEYFMLGDNRPNSDDSRFGLGTVPRENIVGRAVLVIWPPWNFEVGLSHP